MKKEKLWYKNRTRYLFEYLRYSMSSELTHTHTHTQRMDGSRMRYIQSTTTQCSRYCKWNKDMKHGRGKEKEGRRTATMRMMISTVAAKFKAGGKINKEQQHHTPSPVSSGPRDIKNLQNTHTHTHKYTQHQAPPFNFSQSNDKQEPAGSLSM